MDKTFALHATLKQQSPELAAALMELTLDEMIATVKGSYRAMLTHGSKIHADSLRIAKLKLEAYLACKQQNKEKARTAIDAYNTAASNYLDELLFGNTDQRVVVIGSQSTYLGQPGDENARQYADTTKNTYTMLMWFYNEL